MDQLTKSGFRVTKVTNISDLKVGDELSESDLCIQNEERIYQFEYVKSSSQVKLVIEPNIYSAVKAYNGVNVEIAELRERQLLTSVVNTKAIIKEADTFFSNLDVYDQLGETKSRKILLYSEPGLGKTAAITHYCLEAIKQDKGTVVLIWPTSAIDSDDMLNFLSNTLGFSDKCTRLILVMEDIGGGEREGSFNSRAVDSALLDILDGIRVTFRIPTFMIATTNYPQNLLSALADRPGRFDLMLELNPPSYKEKIEIVEFFAKRQLSNQEKDALFKSDIDNFSIAHLKEAVIRSMLHKKSLPTVLQELVEHKKRFNNSFEKTNKKSVGFFDE